MNPNIPIFIMLLNDTELNIYKNKVFIKLMKQFLNKYGLYYNCVFIYNGEENHQTLIDADITNTYKVNTIDFITHENEFKAVYEYLTNINIKYDWFITMDICQISKDPNTIYEAIRNISDNYDFLCFSSYSLNKLKYKLNENNKLISTSFKYKDDIIKHIDTSLFITKVKWFMQCCKDSNFDVDEFGKCFWKGNYQILDTSNQLNIHLLTKGQVDNFIEMINDILDLNKSSK